LVHIENWKKKGKPVDVKFSSWFTAGSTPTSAHPPTYLEQKRKEAQSQYLEEINFIENNKPDFDRMIEEDKRAMANQMPDNLFGMLGALAGRKQEPGGQGEGKGGTRTGTGTGKEAEKEAGKGKV